jgi:hypothetical protein
MSHEEAAEMTQQTKTISLVGVLVAIGSLLTCGTARANGGPPDYLIDEMTQNGQDVEVVIKSLHRFTNLSLVRAGEDYEKVLFEDEPIMEELEPLPYCWDSTLACTPEEGGCHDCDGDGIDECHFNNECLDTYFFHYYDECVYPGKTEYRLYTGEVGGDDEGDYAHNRYLEIEDTGADCDYDITFYDDDTGGCSVSKLGSGEPVGLGLVLLMLATGTLAMGRRHRD